MSDITTAVARQGNQREQATVKSALLDVRIATEIQRALPKHMDGDRMARIALTLVRQSDIAKAKSNGRSKSLSECNVESFVAALMTASALGLEPGVNGECYLIPYGTEATLQVGYQGMLKLAWQHPLVKQIGSGYVVEGDMFEYEDGLDAYLRHRPVLANRANDPIAFYAFAELTTGGRSFVVMNPDQVARLRGVDVDKVIHPPQANVGRTILDTEHQMARKTVLRQLLKPLPKSVAAGWAHQVDEQPGSRLAMDRAPEVIAATVDRPAIEQTGPPDGPAFPEGSDQTPPQGDDPWAK